MRMACPALLVSGAQCPHQDGEVGKTMGFSGVNRGSEPTTPHTAPEWLECPCS